MQVEEGSERGYGSTASQGIVMKLRKRGIYTRPLGNVVYLMVAPNTSREVCDWLLQTLITVLQEM